MALLADTARELERLVCILEAVTQRWGLAINTSKTKLLFLNAETCPNINIRGEQLEQALGRAHRTHGRPASAQKVLFGRLPEGRRRPGKQKARIQDA
ncbi:unnamed protein product [Sphagnum compactum]